MPARLVDVAVVGGGVSGLLTARELRAAGHSVCVVERGDVGREASWAGGGILSPLYPWRYGPAVTALARWGQARYPDLCTELESLSGVDPEYERSGMLVLDETEIMPALVWGSGARARVEGIDRDGIGRLAPGVAASGECAAWLPEVGQVRNPRLVKALLGAVTAMGVTVRSGEPVSRLELREGRFHAVVTNAGRIAAGSAVVTTGAWAAELIGELGPLAIKPIRGQMVVFETAPGTIRPIVLAGGRYVIPRRDGRVLVGSTLEDAGFDKRTTEQAAADLAAAAGRIVPALADRPVAHHWAGLRPGTPDGIPYIGEVPGAGGLFVNAGHYRNGVVLGPAAARLTADLVMGRDPVVDPAPYALERPRAGDFGL